MIAVGKGQTKSIPGIAGEDMDVKMENLLHRRSPIGQKQVHPFAWQVSGLQSARNPLGGEKDGCRIFGTNVAQSDGMSCGNNQNVARVHGLDVHKSTDAFVAIDDRCFDLASNDVAEDAGHDLILGGGVCCLAKLPDHEQICRVVSIIYS